MSIDEYKKVYDILRSSVHNYSNGILNFELLTLDNLSTWESMRKSCNYEQIGFSQSSINYFREYNINSPLRKEVFPSILYANRRPISLVLIEFRVASPEFSTIEMEIEFLDQIEMTVGFVSFIKLHKEKVIELLNHIIRDTSAERIIFKNRGTKNASYLDSIFPAEFKTHIIENYVLELENRNHDNIWNNFRKSYKNLINQQLKKFQFLILDSTSFREDIWVQFEELHLEVAGYRSRSQKSWRLQLDQIKKDEGFSVFALKRNQLIGGGFFPFSKDETYYGVGAYIRNDKEVTCSHSIQYLAILESLRRGKKKHILGERVEKSVAVDPKLIGISNFKKGFSSYYEETRYYDFK